MSQRRIKVSRHEPMTAGSFTLDRLFLAAQVLLLLVIAVAPWTLGGIDPLVQLFLYAGVFTSGACWVISWLFNPLRRQQQRLPLSLLPIVLGLIFGAVQLVPSDSFSGTPLGPESSMGEISLVNPGLTRESISIYPLATRVELAQITFVLLAFFLASQLFASRDSQLWLFGALTVSGMMLGFFGIAQKLSWNGQLFWSGPVVIDGKPFASFVNRNNAAGYLNLTLAAAFGFLIWSVYRSKQARWLEYRALSNGLPSGFGEHFSALLVRLNRLSRCEVLAASGVLLISAGIVASASRGGIFAMGCGLVAGVIWMCSRQMWRLGLMLALAMLIPALGLIVWLGMTDDIQQRFAELTIETVRENGRSKNWKDVSEGVPQVWDTGSGLGTYRYFHRPFQRHFSQGVYAHAENQYLETLVEGGVVGLGILCLAILAVLIALIRLSRSQRMRKSDGVVCVGLVALVTQMTQALVDFGLILPANSLTMSVLMGSVAGRAVRILAQGKAAWLVALPELRPKLVFPVFVLVLMANSAWSWVVVLRQAIASEAVHIVKQFEERNSDEEELLTCLHKIETALGFRPDDVHLLLERAALKIRLYERQAFDVLKNELSENTKSSVLSDRLLKEMASLSGLHGRILQLKQEGYHSAVDTLRHSTIVRETLAEARDSLLTAKQICPWLPQVDLYLAYLSVLQDDPKTCREHLLQMGYLAPYDDRRLYFAGQLALQSGDYDLAIAYLNRSFSINHQKRPETILSSEKYLPLSVIFSEIVPDDPQIIRQTIEQFRIPGSRPDIVLGLLAKLESMQAPVESAPLQDFLFLSGLRLALHGRLSEARSAFERVLALNPHDMPAHSFLTEVYLKLGYRELARKQVAVAVEANISESEAERLIVLIEAGNFSDEVDNPENMVKSVDGRTE